MRLLGIRVIGSGHYVPKTCLTNKDLEGIVQTTDDWITSRTGIHTRHIVSGEDTTDLAYAAAKKAIEAARIEPSEIDMIIVATFTPERLTPSTACMVQGRLGLNDKQMIAFDLNAACSGFAYGLGVAAQFLQTKVIKRALVIGAEVLSKVVDWEDRNTCVLFGDGSGAVVVEYDGSTNNFSYLNASGDLSLTLATSVLPLKNPLTHNEAGDITLTMNGQEVFKFAVTAIKETILNLLKQSQLSLEDIDLIIPHQANKRIIDKVVKDLKVSQDLFYLNLEKYGNTSAASIPIALDEAIKSGRAKAKNRIMLMGFGGG
ncbi:MAG: beta-ketoacyl-ACP synthase III, partial [Turicibacter sp.]